MRAVVQTGMIPLFVGSWLQILAYNVTGYASAKEWYWLIEPMLLVLVGAVLVRVLSDVLLRRWTMARLALVGSGGLVRRHTARSATGAMPTR